MGVTDTTILQLGLVLLALLVFSKRFQSSKKLPLPPGPPRDPIIGSLRHFPASGFPQVFSKWKDTYGDVVYTNVLGVSTVILNSRKAIEDLMVERAAQYQDRPVMYMWGKLCEWEWSTIIKQAGPEHSQERRLILSSLGPSNIRQWYPIIEKATEGFVRNLAESEGNDFSQALKDHIGSMILQVVYGQGIFEAHGKELIDFNVKAVGLNADITSTFWLVDVFPSLQYLPKWMPFKFLEIAEKSRQQGLKMKDWPLQLVLDEINSESVYPSFARKSLEDGHNQERVRDAAAILYNAGLDTTFITISTFVLAMVLYPEVQKKAQAEIDAFINSENRLPSFDDRHKLPYHELIMKEVLRWNPAAPIALPHRNVEEDEYNGVRIPKNSSVFPNIWQLTHDKDIWKDPDEFRPERYMEPDAQDLPEPSQFVFGFGRRLCPGKHMADRAMYLVIVQMIGLFTIELAPGEVRPAQLFSPEIISIPNLPRVKFTRRNQNQIPLV